MTAGKNFLRILFKDVVGIFKYLFIEYDHVFEQNDALNFHSFLILDKTSSIWQLFPQNFGGGNQLFQIEFISLVLQPLYLLGSFLFKFYFSLAKLGRKFEILHQQNNAKDWIRENKHVFVTDDNFIKESDEDYEMDKSNFVLVVSF